MRCFGVGLGLGGAGLGRSLVGERFALPHLVGLFGGFVADVAGFDATVLGAFVARHPGDCGDEQNCHDRDDDDQNDTAGTHDQHGAYGNGTAVLNAARSFGDEAVLVLWPDDVFVVEVPRAQQLIRAYEQTSCPVLALMPMAPEYSQRYGVPIVKEDLDDGLLRITGLVEKPKPQDAPSSYAAIGGYVVTPGVVDKLREQTKRWYDHKTGEVYLSDAINAYAKGRAVYGQVIQGNWYDTGNPADYLVAQFASALAHPGYRPVLRRLVEEIDRPDPDGTLA